MLSFIQILIHVYECFHQDHKCDTTQTMLRLYLEK